MEGDRNPLGDSAASTNARSAAVSAALADVPDDFGPSNNQSAADESYAPHETQDAGDHGQTASESVNGASQGQPAPTVSTETQIEAPKHWPKDRRDEFATLPNNVKNILLAREKEYNTGLTQNAQQNADHRKRSEAIAEILRPHEADLAKFGLDHAGAVRHLLNDRQAFVSNTPDFVLNYAHNNGGVVPFVQNLIKRSGLTADQLFGTQPAGQQQETGQATDEWVDPMVLQLQEQNRALQGELQSFRQNFQQFQSQHSQREALTMQEEIQSFQNGTDASGNPARPHFETVKPIMKRMMETDPDVAAIPDWKVQEKLQTAYDKAVWLVPEIRQQLIDAQVNQSVTTQVSQATLDKARAAMPRKGSPGANGHAQPGKMTRQEAVAAAMRSTGLA